MDDRTNVIENAKITDIFFGIEDHGCMTLTIYLEGAGWGCGFGGYNIGGKYGTDSIKRLLETLNTNDLYKLKGNYVRVVFDRPPFGKIIRIGDIVEDKWFSFKDYFDEREFEEREKEKKNEQ